MRKITFFKMILVAVTILICSAKPSNASAQVNISAGSTYTQNFDDIGATATASLPTGWKMENISGARTINTAYSSVANTATTIALTYNTAMSSTAGNGKYNFGGTSVTDRAIGGVSSGSASQSVNMFTQLTNNGSADITSFTISYDAERYRNGTNAAGFSIRFYYSTTGLANSWIEVPGLIATFSPNADNNGSTTNPMETINITNKTLNQSIAANSSIYFAWSYSVTSGTTTSSAQALGIDNISIIANAATATVATPTFTPTAGSYTSVQNVTINCTTVGAEIYYTTDGTDPNNTGNGTLYTTSIPVTANKTLKAIAYLNGYTTSQIATATYAINLDPTLLVAESTIPAMSTIFGGTTTQTINVSGTNLSGDVTLALSGTNADQFSITPSTLSPTSGTLASSPVTITYHPTIEYNHAATLTISSANASDITRSLSANATMAKPIATEATSINNVGFTANWNSLSGATDYDLSVYTENGISEYFNNFTLGATGSGANGTDVSTTLDIYTQDPGWTGSKVYSAGGTLKMGTSSILGYLTTPAMDLSANGGAFNISFKSMAWSGDATSIKITLDNGTATTVTGIPNGSGYTMNSFSVDLTGGTTASKIKFEGNQAANGRFFLEDVLITQNSINKTPIPGSPFTVSGETNKIINGLTEGVTYKYSVIGKNTSVTSPRSNVIRVTTGATTGLTPTKNTNIYASNGNIVLSASANQTVEIFNAVGQKLLSHKAVEGINTIPVSTKGLVLVKVGNQISKVIL